jgi:hypothetical protein
MFIQFNLRVSVQVLQSNLFLCSQFGEHGILRGNNLSNSIPKYRMPDRMKLNHLNRTEDNLMPQLNYSQYYCLIHVGSQNATPKFNVEII